MSRYLLTWEVVTGPGKTEPRRFRFEADDDGDVRLKARRALGTTGIAVNIHITNLDKADEAARPW